MNRDWLVDGNIFDGCVSGTVVGGYAWDGLVLSYGPGQVITNNRLRNIGVEGIFVYRLTTPPDNNKKYVVSNNLIDCTPPTGGALINWGIRCDENNAVITGNSICGATCGIMTGPYDHTPRDYVISDNIIQMKFFNGGGSYAIYGIQASAKNAKIHHNLIVWNDSLTGYSALFVCGIYAAANLDRSSITHNKVLVRHPDATIPMEGFRINGDGSTNIFFKDNETDGVSRTFSFDTIYPTAGPWTIETHASKNDNLMFYQPPSPSSYGGKLLLKNQIFAWTPAQTGWYRVLAKPWNISSRFIFGSLNSLSNDAAVEVAYYSDNSSLFNGSINQLRYTKHSSSVITKVRTGTVPAPLGYMCALDIYVAVANKPITLALQGNEQYDLYLLSEMVAGPVWQTRSAPESSPATPEHLKSLTLTDGIATSGGITVGDETVNYAPGTIRFNGTNFFGWNGTAWKQLDN